MRSQIRIYKNLQISYFYSIWANMVIFLGIKEHAALETIGKK